MKIVTIKGLLLLHWFAKFHIDSQAVYEFYGGSQTLKIGHTRAHASTRTHTSGRQLKIKFLDVLGYSEYSGTNISKFFFFTET